MTVQKTIFILTIIFCFLTISPSCKKDEKNITINATIHPNETYHYDLVSFGDEEGAHISRQATHFLTSKIEIDTSNFSEKTYTYTPAQNYIGTDEVELTSERGSDGSSHNNKITITLISLTIKN